MSAQSTLRRFRKVAMLDRHGAMNRKWPGYNAPMSDPKEPEENTSDPPSVERSISPKTAFEMAQGAADAAAESQGQTINRLTTELGEMREDNTKRDKWARIERGFWLIIIAVLAGKAMGIEIPGMGSLTGGTP